MRSILLILSFLIVTVLSHSQEYRAAVSARFEIGERLSAETEAEFRKVFYPGSYFNRTLHAQLTYDISRQWQTAITYSFSRIDKSADFSDEAEAESSEKNRFAWDIGYESKRFDNNLRLSNRFRFQFSMMDDNRPKTYLRNRLMLDYRISDLMNPYIAVEPYFNIRAGELKQVRLYIGNEFPVGNHELELYYIAEVRRRDEIFYMEYIVGLTFKVKIAF